MKEGWEKRRLSEVLERTETVDPTKKPNEDFNYIDVSAVNNQTFFVESVQTLKGKDAPSRARKLVKGNDVIFATVRPTLKRIAFISEANHQHVCSTGYAVLRANADVVDGKYLFYFLLTDEFIAAMARLQKGASYPAVTDREVKDQFLSYPKSIAEQRRIVSILDETFDAIDSAKANIEKNICNSKELFESELNSMLSMGGDGWIDTKLGEVCNGFLYGTSTKSQDSGKVAVLRMGNIQDRHVIWDNLVYTSVPQEIEKYSLRQGDVLFNRTNSTELVGKSAIYNLKHQAIFAGYLIKIIRNEDRLDSEFLNYYLNSSKVRQHGFSVMISSVSQANISSSKLKEYPIALPPLQEQQAIVGRLNSILERSTALKTLYEKKLTKLASLKKSILQKAFSGELTSAQLVEDTIQQ